MSAEVEDLSLGTHLRLDLEARPTEMGLDESSELRVNLSVMGRLRDIFDQGYWTEAYNLGERQLRFYFTISIVKAPLFSRRLLGPHKFVKRVILYWSRNPELVEGKIGYHTGIWAMLIPKEGGPFLPRSIPEAKSALFDHQGSYTILGKDLGKGVHTLFAEAKVRWGRHHLIKKGSVSGKSKQIKVICR